MRRLLALLKLSLSIVEYARIFAEEFLRSWATMPAAEDLYAASFSSELQHHLQGQPSLFGGLGGRSHLAPLRRGLVALRISSEPHPRPAGSLQPPASRRRARHRLPLLPFHRRVLRL